MGVITTPFSGLVVQWYSWISEQVMAKENNTQSFSSVVSGWTKVAKEHHSRACLARPQRWRVFLCGHSLTKILQGLFFAVWLAPSKTAKFNHPRKFVPIRYCLINIKEYSVAMYIQFSSCCCLGLGASV